MKPPAPGRSALPLPAKLRLAASFFTGALIVALMTGVLALAFGYLTPPRKMAERQLSAALGVPVRIGTLILLDGGKTAEATDIVIGNPPGFAGPHAFRAAKAVAAIGSISPRLLALDALTITGVEAALETGAGSVNLVSLAESADPAAAVKYRARPGSPALKIAIAQLRVENMSIGMEGRAQAAMPAINLAGIGGEGGILVSQAAAQLAQELSRRALLAAISLRYTAGMPQDALAVLARFLAPVPARAERLQEISRRFVERFDAFSYFYPAVKPAR